MADVKAMQRPEGTPSNGLFSVFQEFNRLEASGGIVLMVFTALALVWANSPWAESYFDIWQTKMTVGLGSWTLSKALILWINDGLMAIFFFVVGLEIKREVLTGELASPRRAALPLAAALGGMVVPAAIYGLINIGQPGAGGWGIPMATDIAFTLGVLALLGTRAPLSLKVFVTALAIVDDIGAVLVIALFYTSSISWASIAVAAGLIGLLLLVNRLRIDSVIPYVVLGVGVWLAMLYSGVHATIAGVMVAMTIPARAHADRELFVQAAHKALEDYEEAVADDEAYGVNKRAAATWALEVASERAESPLQKMEHELHPWVIYVIMPIFALANAGVQFTGVEVGLLSPVALGVMAGLALGKPLGITLASWLALRLGLAEMPQGLRLRHILGGGFLAGIGFTMALFIANLALSGALLTAAKVGILLASLAAGLVGWVLLRTMAEPAPATSRQEASAPGAD